MSYSTNMYNEWEVFQHTEIQNSIFIGGPKHLEIVDNDGSDMLRYHEMPSIEVRPMTSHLYYENVTTNVHTYYRVEVVFSRFKGHVYMHQ